MHIQLSTQTRHPARWLVLSLVTFSLLLPGAPLSAATKKNAKKAKKQTKATKKQSKSKAKSPKRVVKVSKWLQLGPASAPLPAFHKEKRGKYTYASFLKSQQLHQASLHPKAGQPQDWFLGQTLTWKTTNGTIPQAKRAAVTYLATYLEADRYLKLSLALKSHQRLRVYLNGRYIAQKTTCTKPKRTTKRTTRRAPKKKAKAPTRKQTPTSQPSKPAPQAQVMQQLLKLLQQQNKIIAQQAQTIAKHTKTKQPTPKQPKAGTARATLTLTPGVHLLVVKSLATPGCVSTHRVQGSIHGTKKSPVPTTFRATTTPYERHSIDFYMYRKHAGSYALSPDGKQVIMRVWNRTKAGSWNQRIEIRSTKTGALLHTALPNSHLVGIRWSPKGTHYAHAAINRRKRVATIWLTNVKSGATRALRKGIRHFRWNSLKWAPNGQFLLYATTHKEKPTKNEKVGAKRLRNMNDRWPWYRTRNAWHALTIRTGQSTQLTAGSWNVGNVSIRHDGKRIVFTRSTPNYKARPFGQTDVYELDLATMALQKLIKGLRWLNAVQYAPNGKHLLLQGGPSLLGSLGRTKALGTKTTANDYEGELYLYNLHTRSYRTLTKSFAPHVVSAHWHPVDGKIYITALDRTRYQLFRCHPRTGTITPVNTGVDIVRSLQFASKNLQVVYSGQSLTHPARVYTLNLAKPTPRMLYAPNGKWFSRLRMSRVKSWNTVSKQGTKIEGRVYYPPDFDPRRKYPAIVYYYGGTFPTPRYFDGAYSGHLWAAHGYVVYILQPSGAIGYGQTFAARHVGEWGTIVPGEIISSTRAFLKAHPFVDPKRVGCTGASYGGFTTMSIVTKTSLFAAAISHAGISNVTSYWGAGYWGFLYSSIAAAHKYPWSHPNYFLKQSPLFSAHKVTTPLLLIHGTNDVNVPPAESYQMYTALRLLKKPVELVLFKGEGHGIFKKRHLWIQTIIAWFEKNLKKRPLWWNTMYGTQQR